MRGKGQAALEFLMTYGWAILIVIVAIGALYATGMLKPCKWVGTQVREFPLSEVKVEVVRLTSSELVFNVYYQKPGTATLNNVIINSATADGTSFSADVTTKLPLSFSQTTPVTVTLTYSISKGACVDFDLTLNITRPEGGWTIVSGKISGPAS